MTLKGEVVGIDGTTCGCGTVLKLRVLSSAAGSYLGYWCDNCGPYSRESGYMSPLAAQRLLEKLTTKDTDD